MTANSDPSPANPSPPAALRPAVFLDRDGTLNVAPPEGGYILRPEELELAPGAGEALRRLREAGYFLALATNQRCVALGLLTLGGLDAIHERLQNQLRIHGAELDAIRSCPEDRGSPRRKPSPAMLLEVAEEFGIDLAASWMIGDSVKDVGAALAAGVRPILIDRPGSGEGIGMLAPEVESRVEVVSSIGEAANLILFG